MNVSYLELSHILCLSICISYSTDSQVSYAFILYQLRSNSVPHRFYRLFPMPCQMFCSRFIMRERHFYIFFFRASFRI